MTTVDAARLAGAISSLRRILLSAARDTARLPEIPDAQIEILRTLFRQAPLGSGELATRLGLNRSTISNLLTAMEGSELIERVAADGDGRRVEVWPTARATDLFTRFDRTTSVLVEEALGGLSPHQRKALVDAVEPLEALSVAVKEIASQRQPAPKKRKV